MTTELNTTVTVEAITEFARENVHFMDRYGDPVVEKFVAISMRATDGTLLRNFTKFNREFPLSVAEGDTFSLTYRVKDTDRVCPETGESYTASILRKSTYFGVSGKSRKAFAARGASSEAGDRP